MKGIFTYIHYRRNCLCPTCLFSWQKSKSPSVATEGLPLVENIPVNGQVKRAHIFSKEKPAFFKGGIRKDLRAIASQSLSCPRVAIVFIKKPTFLGVGLVIYNFSDATSNQMSHCNTAADVAIVFIRRRPDSWPVFGYFNIHDF